MNFGNGARPLIAVAFLYIEIPNQLLSRSNLMLRNDWKSQLPRSCLSPKRDWSIKQTATVVQEVTLLVAKSHLLLQIWRFSDLVSTIHAQVVLLLYRDHIPACHASSGNEISERNVHPSALQGGESLPFQEKKRLYRTTNLFSLIL